MHGYHALRRRYWLGTLAALLGMIALPLVHSASAAYTGALAGDAPALAPPTPAPSDKNGGAWQSSGSAAAETAPASPGPGSKNSPDRRQPTIQADQMAAMLAAGGSLITCGGTANTSWTTVSSSYQVVRQCTLTLPSDGKVFISADGSLARSDGEYEAAFMIGIDDTVNGENDTDRWVNVYSDSSDGTDKSVAISVLKPVTAGEHTFYFLGSRNDGAGTVLVYYPSFTVIFIPSSSAQIIACGASADTDWGTVSSDFEVIQECTLNAPQTGWAFIAANGSLARYNGEYEANFRIGIDNSSSGEVDTDRWVDVYSDGGDGTDEIVALSALKPVPAGAHTFSFLGSRYYGAGAVHVYDPTLAVIFIPAASVQAVACGASADIGWWTTSSDFAVIQECTLNVPQGGWVFLTANGSLAFEDDEYEANFVIGIDNTVNGEGDTHRWVNIYNDSIDGTDKSVAISALKPVTAGAHTFYFLGRRYAGAGRVRVYDPTLAVIAPGAQTYVPLITKK